MAVTIEHTGSPAFPWRVSSECATKAEAFAKAAKVEEVNPEAFKPVPVPAAQIAHSDGHTADGGGIVAPDIAAAMIRDRVLASDDDTGAPGEPPRCSTGGCDGD